MKDYVNEVLEQMNDKHIWEAANYQNEKKFIHHRVVAAVLVAACLLGVTAVAYSQGWVFEKDEPQAWEDYVAENTPPALPKDAETEPQETAPLTAVETPPEKMYSYRVHFTTEAYDKFTDEQMAFLDNHYREELTYADFGETKEALGLEDYTVFIMGHPDPRTQNDTIHHFVVSQYGTESRTPVYHGFAQVSDTIVHQDFLLFLFTLGIPFFGCEMKFFTTSYVETFCTLLSKTFFKFADRHCLLACVAIEVTEHLLESPLCPVVINRFASAYFTIPIKTETNLIQLFAIAVDVGFGSYSRMLTCLDGILFSRKSICIVTHRIQYIKSLQTLVTGINIAGNITERVTYVQSRTRRVREHIQYVELLL